MTYRKKLICSEQNPVNTGNFLTNQDLYEHQPFDGAVVSAQITHPIFGTQSLHNYTWTGTPLPWWSFRQARANLRGTSSFKLSDKFILVKNVAVTANGEPPCDWYDPGFSAVLHNFRMAARLAKEGFCRGLAFDLEPDNTDAGYKVFKYTDRPYHGTYTYPQYETQVRTCGQWLMEAIQDEFPSMDFWFFFGYEQAIKTNNPPISTDNYGLLTAFLDGMFDAATDEIKIHNMYEDGYQNLSNAATCTAIATQDKSIMDNPSYILTSRYNNRMRRGYSTWLDIEGNSFDQTTPTNNHWNLTNIQTGLTTAQSLVIDKYQLQYAERVKFLANPATVHQNYQNSFQSARVTMGYDYTFSPSTLPNATAYFDPTTMGFTDNTGISTYTDALGIVYTQATGGKQPVFKATGLGGIQGVLFAAASSQLLSAAGIITPFVGTNLPMTWIGVIKSASAAPGSNEFVLGMGVTAATPSCRTSIVCTTTSLYSCSRVADGGTSVSVNGNPALDTNAHVLTVRQSGSACEIRLDGVSVANNVTQAVGAQTMTTCLVGARAIQTPDSFFDGYQGQWVLSSQALGLADIQVVERQFGVNYGITVV